MTFALTQKRASSQTPSLVGGSSPVVSAPATKNLSPGLPAYWSSLVTSCCTLLAWANAEMPVWLRISYFDMAEVADA